MKRSKLTKHLKCKFPKNFSEKGDCWTREMRERQITMEGWLSPAGVMYYCNFMGHEDLAQLIIKEKYNEDNKEIAHSAYLERKNWIKLHYPEGFILWLDELPDPTQRQLDFMFTYAEKIGQDIKKDLEKKEENRKNAVKWANQRMWDYPTERTGD